MLCIFNMKNSWKEIYLLNSTNQSRTNHNSPDVFLCTFFLKMLSRQSKRDASEGTSVTSCIQIPICQWCPAGHLGYSFIPSLNAESCWRRSRWLGLSGRRDIALIRCHLTRWDTLQINPGFLPAVPRNASGQAAALFGLLALFWHPVCCGMTASGRAQDSRNQRCSQATRF